MKDEEALMETKEVLARLKISRPTLYTLMREGKLVPIKNPVLKRGRLLFRQAEVERLLREGR